MPSRRESGRYIYNWNAIEAETDSDTDTFAEEPEVLHTGVGET